MTLFCSFCGKSQHEVAKLIAGPTVHICSECVDLCHNIVHPSGPDRPAEPPDLSHLASTTTAAIAALRQTVDMLQAAVRTLPPPKPAAPSMGEVIGFDDAVPTT